MATVAHLVVQGDTLSSIAAKYGTTVDNLVKLNNIVIPDLIFEGQIIYISGKPATEGAYGPPVHTGDLSNMNTVSITGSGLQANSRDTAFVVWEWNRANTAGFEIGWDYYSGGLWFNGIRTTIENDVIKNSTYNVPDNATMVRCHIRPIAKTYQANVGYDTHTVSCWTALWCSYVEIAIPPKTGEGEGGSGGGSGDVVEVYKPGTPGAPDLKIEGYNLTVTCDNLADKIESNGTDPYLEFEIIKDDVQCIYRGQTKIVYFSASYTCKVEAGRHYKARARIIQGPAVGDYGPYSGNGSTIPSVPNGIRSCRATSATSINLSWYTVPNAKSYDIEYAIKKEYLGGSNASTIINNVLNSPYEITGLTSGERYFLRVRAVNAQGTSDWCSDIANVIIGTKPSSPTTWSSTTTAISGEELILYWIHNCEDGSREVRAEVEINDGANTYTRIITNETSEDDDYTGQLELSTSAYVEGTSIKWRVRTCGITQEYGDWSVQRTVDIFAPPTLDLELLDKDNEPLYTLHSFPFKIRGTAGPNTQTPLSFHVSIISNATYETVDEVGNFKMVVKGDEVYAGYFDISYNLDITITPDMVDLQSNVEYEVRCIVSMNSGLTAEKYLPFTVAWIDETFIPNAEIIYDSTNYIVNIRPYCEYYPIKFYKVDYTNESWHRTEEEIPFGTEGISVDNAFTVEHDDVVYAGYVDDILTHFCIVQSINPEPVPDITLSVYRRDFNGKFIEVGNDLSNDDNAFITDPHPPLDFARYRVVAMSNKTGAIGYTDLPAYPIQEKAIIIQWDEKWSPFDSTLDGRIDEPTWAGSILRLPYNIDVSESNSSDVSLVKYIGREHPVSYYGTHVGIKATWNTEIPKKDINTIHALRRLATYMGDVYVREPSGSGYWASIAVSFNVNHVELVVPVTLNITRVEGGV